MCIIITYLVVQHKLTYIVGCRAYYLSTILTRVFVCILLQYVTVLYTVFRFDTPKMHNSGFAMNVRFI